MVQEKYLNKLNSLTLTKRKKYSKMYSSNINNLNMNNLEKQGRPRISPDTTRSLDRSASFFRSTFAAMAAMVVMGLVACSGPIEKCLEGGQGTADKKMLEKWSKRCKIRKKMYEDRTGEYDDAYRACQLLNNKSFEVEDRILRTIKTAALEEDEDKIDTCKKARKKVREIGDKGANAIGELKNSQ